MSETQIAISFPSAENAKSISDAPDFDYSQMDAETEELARKTITHAREVRANMTADILEMGANLIKVKARLDHGLFMQWVHAEFPFEQRTANNYMNAASVFGGKMEIVSNLPPSTVYHLAARATPESIREAVVKRIEAGERLDPEVIKQEVATAREEEKEARRLEQLPPEKRKAEMSRKKRRMLEIEKNREEEARLDQAATIKAEEIFNRLRIVAGENFSELFGFFRGRTDFRVHSKIHDAIEAELEQLLSKSPRVAPGIPMNMPSPTKAEKRIRVSAADLEIPEDMPHPDEQQVSSLMASILSVGLTRPIPVYFVDDFMIDGEPVDHVPILAGCRDLLEAIKRVGIKVIECNKFEDAAAAQAWELTSAPQREAR